MNNEIKEILDYISDRVIEKEKWNEVRDYITNLQQENERLKEERHRLLYNLEKVCEEDEEDEDYKSRIEKAIPMLKELNIKMKSILNTGIDIKEISDIEDILNGRSDE